MRIGAKRAWPFLGILPMEYSVDFFFGVSRDIILQLGEGIGLLENCVRFSAIWHWTIIVHFKTFCDEIKDLK